MNLQVLNRLTSSSGMEPQNTLPNGPSDQATNKDEEILSTFAPCCEYSGGVGLFDVYSDEVKKKSNNRYDVGNGRRLPEEEAYEFLLKRDFPDDSFEDGHQKQVVFSPPFFVDDYIKCSDGRKLVKERTTGQLLEAEMLSKLKDHFKDKKANMTVISDWERNWTMLRPSVPGGEGKQHDFILIDGDRKLIILIEAKNSLNLTESDISKRSKKKTPQTPLEIASSQLAAQRKYFKDYHGHVLTEEWQVACVIACREMPNKRKPCTNCQHFILNLDTELDDWMEEIQKLRPEKPFDFNDLADKNLGLDVGNLDEKPKVPTEVAKAKSEVSGAKKMKVNCYKRLVGRIVGLSLTCDKFLGTTTTFRNAIHSTLTQKCVATPPQIDKMFLTPQQSNILKCEEEFVCIEGSCGTGKTVVLMLKAIQKIEAGENVTFLFGNFTVSAQPEYVCAKVEKEFQDWETEWKRKEAIKGVEEKKKLGVMEFRLARDLEESDILEMSKTSHIFWDELNEFFWGELKLHSSTHFLDSLNTKNFIWIAKLPFRNQFSVWFDLSSVPDPIPLNFFTITLDQCLRNSLSIQKFLTILLRIWFHEMEKSSQFSWIRDALDGIDAITYVNKLIPNSIQLEINTIATSSADDMPILILAKSDHLDEAVKEALKGYTTSVVFIDLPNELDLSHICEGWEVKKLIKNPEISDSTKTIYTPDDRNVNGMEFTNVILFDYRFTASLGFKNRMFCMATRAVAHLTVIQQLDLDENLDEVYQRMSEELAGVGKVIKCDH